MIGFQEQVHPANAYENNTELYEMSILDPTSKVDPIKLFDQTTGQAHTEYLPPVNDNGNESDVYYLPTWQTSPLLQRRYLNEDILSQPNATAASAHLAIASHQAVLGSFVAAPFGKSSHSNPSTSKFATLHSMASATAANADLVNVSKHETHYLGEPLTYLYIPIFDKYDVSTRKVVAVLQSLIHWRSYLRMALPQDIPPIRVVLDMKCPSMDGHDEASSSYTYEVQGQEAYIVGFGDDHNAVMDKYKFQAEFAHYHLNDGTVAGVHVVHPFQDDYASATTTGNVAGACHYDMRIYPTQLFMDTYKTDTPLAITFAIAVVFIFTIW